MEVAFQVALAQIGAATVADALTLWDRVPPTARPATVASWLKDAVALVMKRRGASRDLAMAYYRLVRALRTGTTIPDPANPDPPYVTLGELRRQFDGLAGTEVPREERPERPATTTPTSDTDPAPEAAEVPTGDPYEPSQDDEDERILIEELEQIERDAEEDERLAEEETRIALEALGPKNQTKKTRDIDPEEPSRDVDVARDAAHKEAGARQAAAASRVARDGARSAIWNTAARDQRAIGYVRLSRTGTPCGWCAMLISRGPVYKSEESATYKGAAAYDDGDKYHDNCNCYAMPVFAPDQYDDSDLFALNREYAVQWPRVTRGLSGKAAVSAWRRFIRSEKQTRAQAARTPN